jgi:hypothetical protein
MRLIERRWGVPLEMRMNVMIIKTRIVHTPHLHSERDGVLLVEADVQGVE